LLVTSFDQLVNGFSVDEFGSLFVDTTVQPANSAPIQGSLLSKEQTQPTSVTVKATRTSPDQTQADEPCSFTLRGLPNGISTIDLCAVVSSSSDFIEARIVGDDVRGVQGHISARLLFSTRAGAEKARHSMEAMLKIVSAESPVQIEIDSDSNLESPSNGVPASPPERRGRHGFSQEDIAYLEKQFEVNPRPTARQRRIFAAQLGVDEKQIRTWFNDQHQRQKCEDAMTDDYGQSREISADPAGNNSQPNENSTAPIPISRKRLNQPSMNANDFSPSPIERFRASPPGCEGEPRLEVIAAAAKLAAQGKAADTGRELPKDNAHLNSRATYSGEIVTRRSYARSVASGGSGWSYWSTRSARSAGSSNTIASKASMSSFASTMSRTSRKPRVSRISRVVNKARHDSKKIIRRTRAKVITGVCARPEPVLDRGMIQAHAVAEGPLTNLRVSIALRCDSCSHVSEIFVGDPQVCNVYCHGCQKYLGLYRKGARNISLTFKLCCRGCHAWVETTILNKDIQDNMDFKEDYDFCCHKCQEQLFEATILSLKPVYDCTFCEMRFSSKFGWRQHETTIHHQKEVWVCRLDEASVFHLWPCSLCGRDFCQDNPWQASIEHADAEHRFRHCKDHEKSFGRKDELVQHLREFHRYSKRELPSVETWTKRVAQPDMVWKCGICDMTFTEWFVRLNHIEKHWEAGQTMRD
jgi:hypothetical protein